MMARPQYYAEMGKPTPKTEVMRYLKVKRYVDAKDFAGECEDVVVVARGQGEIDHNSNGKKPGPEETPVSITIRVCSRFCLLLLLLNSFEA